MLDLVDPVFFTPGDYPCDPDLQAMMGITLDYQGVRISTGSGCCFDPDTFTLNSAPVCGVDCVEEPVVIHEVVLGEAYSTNMPTTLTFACWDSTPQTISINGVGGFTLATPINVVWPPCTVGFGAGGYSYDSAISILEFRGTVGT